MSERERPPIAELIERWRVSPSTSWDEVIGHEPQVLRLRELIAKLALPAEERKRLGLRVGSGVLISGAAGCGKTMLAKACATALGRDVIAPPSGELDAELIGDLYRALAEESAEPTVVIIDEAEALVGHPDWHSTDEPAQRAFLHALDGVNRPETGPVTIALTAASPEHLSDQACRPGRLAPRLSLEPPTAADRAELLARAVAGLPGAEALDGPKIVERTAGWTGAEIAGLVEESMTRSLLLGIPGAPTGSPPFDGPGLRTDVMLDVVAEHFVIRDPVTDDRRDDELSSRHEAGHSLWAHLTWGSGAVAVVDVHERGGTTTLADWVSARRPDRAELRRLAGLGFAGAAAEHLVFGRTGTSQGSAEDRAKATKLLDAVRRIGLPSDDETFEGGYQSRGSEAMRRARYEEVRLDADNLWDEVIETLRPHIDAIGRLGDAFLMAPGATLSGDELTVAIRTSLAAMTKDHSGGSKRGSQRWPGVHRAVSSSGFADGTARPDPGRGHGEPGRR